MANAPPPSSWKTDSLDGLARGSPVWWKSSPTEWLPATLQSVGPKDCTIALDTTSGPGTGKVSLYNNDLPSSAARTGLVHVGAPR